MDINIGAHPRANRRDFLHVGAATMLGFGLSGLLRRTAAGSTYLPSWPAAGGRVPPAENLIMIWLAGGPATIDMWDMKPDAPAGIRGEFSPVHSSADGVQICEHMPQLARVMHHACLVRSVHHTLAAHEPGTQLLLTGNLPGPAIEFPALGSIASKLMPPIAGVPSFITLGDDLQISGGYLGAAYAPYPVANSAQPNYGGPQPATQTNAVGLPDGFSVDSLARRAALLRSFDQTFALIDHSPMVDQLGKFQQQALDILRSNRTRAALDLSKEPEATLERYGRGPFGLRVLAARRLVEAGVRCVTVGMSGWDTHNNNFAQLRNNLLPQLDKALSALVIDLDQRGMLETTIIYCTGEFGRTPHINGGAGRDHWARAMSVFLAGGALRRGFVYGATDAQGFEPAENACSPMDVSASVLHSLGIRHDDMLETQSGRPMPIVGNGAPIASLFELDSDSTRAAPGTNQCGHSGGSECGCVPSISSSLAPPSATLDTDSKVFS
jgi:uncharacterized protein (DUF1501 family)